MSLEKCEVKEAYHKGPIFYSFISKKRSEQVNPQGKESGWQRSWPQGGEKLVGMDFRL